MSEGYRTAVDAAAIFSETDLAGNIIYVNENSVPFRAIAHRSCLGKTTAY